jgi:hypothetical protein
MLVANCLGDSLLIWLVFNGLFLWSPIYESKKEVIDRACDTACNTLRDLKAKVDTFIPKYKDIKQD